MTTIATAATAASARPTGFVHDTATVFVRESRPLLHAVAAAETFSITVHAVNDAPTFAPGAEVTVAEDSGTYSATWATNIVAKVTMIGWSRR